MALISSSIPNLINGVSQQPFMMRLASQCEDQVNADASVTEGLRKRPGTRLVKKLMSSLASGSMIHTINRDGVEQYTVFFTGSGIRVFDMAGTEKTVNYGSGALAYATVSDPRTNLSILTVADYTFVVNKTVTVARTNNKTTALAPKALVWIRQGDYKKKYGITLNGTEYAYQTSTANTNSSEYDPGTIKTDWIANELATAIPSATFTVVRDGSVFTIRKNDNTDFTIKARDSMGDQAIIIIKGQIQRFNLLPEKAIGGFQCKVVGDDGSDFTDYYVKYEDNPETNGYVWHEAGKDNEYYELDASTMPHVLVREADGTFTFRKATWDNRRVGDLDSDPFPSFVGRKIKDVFFHRNRLGFLTGENVVLSADGEFFRFFRESVIQVLDTDPIDIAVSHTKVSILEHAVSFNDGLFLFAGQTQFQIGKPDLLTPKTISVNSVSEFEFNTGVKPVASGSNIYFIQRRGAWSAVREYYIDEDTKASQALDITSHVPKYVPSSVRKIVTSTTENMVVMLPESGADLFVYRYYVAERAKVQSAWCKFSLPGVANIRNIDFIESTLWMIVERSNGVYLESMSMEVGRTDGAYHAPLLDHMVTETACTVSYNSGTNTTTVTLPGDYLTTSDASSYLMVAWASDATYTSGTEVAFTRVADNQLTVVGNLTKFRFGRVYDYLYRFSRFVLRSSAPGGGQEAKAAMRVQLRKMELVHADSGYFVVTVRPYKTASPSYQYVHSGFLIGENSPGDIPDCTGTFRVPLLGKAEDMLIEVTSRSWLPVNLLSAEWEAIVHERAQKV